MTERGSERERRKFNERNYVSGAKLGSQRSCHTCRKEDGNDDTHTHTHAHAAFSSSQE